MNNQSSLLTIQQALPEAHWPVVFGALRNDELVWQAFGDSDFISAAVARCGADPLAWSPANLALLMMNLDLEAAELSHDEGKSLPGEVRRQAILVFERCRRAEPGALPDLAEAGWLALALHERYRVLKSWHGLLDEIGSERLPFWDTAFACLYGMITNPIDCLATIAVDENGHRLLVKTILSQPETLDAQAGILSQVARSIPIGARLRVLRACQEKKPHLAQAVANLLLHGSDQASISNELSRPDSDRLDELTSLETLTQQFYQTTLHALGDQHAHVQAYARQTQHHLQLLYSRVIALDIATFLSAGDISNTLKELAVHTSQLCPGDRQALTLALLAHGQADKALELAAEDQNSALYLLVQARLLQQQSHTAAAQAAILTAFEHTLDHRTSPDSFNLLEEIAATLLELNRPVEAARLYKLLIESRADCASYYARLARSERLAGNSGQAVEAAYMAVALQPSGLEFYTELALALESAGEWQAAYETRQTIFNRLHKGHKALAGISKAWIQTDQLRILARSALQAGHTQQASALAQQALEQAPDDGLAHVILGDIELASGDKTKALQHYREANNLSPDAAETWLALARAYLAENDQAKALETLKMGAQALPDEPEIHLALGDHLIAQGYPTEALYQYRKAADLLRLPVPQLEQEALQASAAHPLPKRPFLTPQSAAIYLRIGKTLNALGRFAEARPVLALPFATLEHRQDTAPIYAKSLMANGEYREALSALSIAVNAGNPDRELSMDYARALIQVGEHPERAVQILQALLADEPDNQEAIGLMAEALAACGEFKRAMGYYQKALDTRLVDDLNWFARLSVGLGHVALELGQTNLALATLQEATQSAPHHLALHQKLCEAYLAANLNEDALATARRCVELAPADLANLVWFSEIALQLRADVEAITTLKRAVELSPNECGLLLKMAQLQARSGDKEAAHQNFMRIAANPAVTLSQMHHVARGLLDLGDPAGAVACLERLREPSLPSVDSVSIDLLMDLAEAYEQVEDDKQALQLYEEILGRNPHLGSVHKRKARLHLRLGSPLAALACLEYALQLTPGDREAHQLLMSIHHADGNLPQAILHAQRAAVAARQSIDYSEALQTQYHAAALNWLALDAAAAYDELQLDLSKFDLNASQESSAYLGLKAQLEFELGMEAEATRSAETLSALAAEHPATLPALARLLYLDGKAVEAREKLSQAITTIDAGDIKAALQCAAVVATALQLADYPSAHTALSRWLACEPCEPLPYFLWMKTLVLEAEEQKFMSLMQVVNHAPGEHALDAEAANAFQQALKSVLSRLPGADQKPDETNARINLPDFIKTWQIRGTAVFSASPSAASLQALERLEPGPDNNFAFLLALLYSGQAPKATAVARVLSHQPRSLALQALALLETNPAEALASALSAIEAITQSRINLEFPIYSALLATVALRIGDPSQALQAITTALEEWPDEPRWHRLAAEINKALGNSRNMIQHLEKAIAISPGNPAEQVELAETYVETGLYNKAIQIYEAAFEQNGGTAETALRLAQIHLLRDDLIQSETWTRKTIELNGKLLDAHLLYADLCMRKQDHQHALEHLEAALALKPDHPLALHKLAGCLVSHNRREEAIQVLDQIIQSTDDALPIALEQAALVRSVYGVKRAIELLISLDEQYDHHPSIVTLLAEYLHEHGQSKLALEMAQSALQALSANMEADGALQPAELARLYFLSGRLQRKTGQLDQAIHHLSKALQLSPANVELYLELGQTYQDRRELDHALQIYQKAIETAPDDARPYRQAGLALKEGKDYLAAERMIRKAAELSPHDISIHRLLGSLVALNLVHNAG